jgi:anhydro-N-acetylmuramic acid kinase
MKSEDPLGKIAEKKKKLVVGLMSGTSADGVDAALVEIDGFGLSTKVRLVEHATFPYSQSVRDRIHQTFAGTVKDVCEMNFVLGELFAEAAVRIIRKAGLENSAVDLIGSHGQTVYHITKNMEGVTSTLQIGESSVIAERTGIPVVSDFRTRDIAAGGSGAPLVPYIDFILFRRTGRTRALQNIGGIANVAVIPENRDGVTAFDTGPGNMAIDELAKIVMKDHMAIDEDGKLSALGNVDKPLLKVLLKHPFLTIKPPKSTGRETFGKDFVYKLIEHYDDMLLLDLLATVCRFTAESMYAAYRDFIFPAYKIDEVIISGGGVHNKTLLAHLRELFDPVPILTLEDLGFKGDAMEALAFAILANEFVHESPANLKGATGASKEVVLGKICF